ncbi:MAG: 2,3-bisphosphoglycerate-independent phosphoglycerate mutase [Candidatus Omnitrophica bacterium]|nr:2,3-bisphosphoglycerate-independent phosphoglycerate mutase [Candidatus Omnitrophota bacterium]
MKKLLYVILDGVGDLPIKELVNKTPLEAANTPNMDRLASKGKGGYVYTVGEGIAPESDIGVISILGYDAHKYYTGRGPLESYAEGLDIADGDLAYRVNFATKDSASDKIIDRRVGRNLTTEEATKLAAEINSKVRLSSRPSTFTFKNTIGHRGVLVIKRKDGGSLSAEVTNTDPAYGKEGVFGVAKATFDNVIMKCEPTEGHEDSEEAKIAASLTNEFINKSTAVLSESSVNKKRAREGKLIANLILSRDAGDRLPSFPKLDKVYGKHFGCFVEMPVERGIALLTGMEVVDLPLPSGDLEKDYMLRADKVLEVLKNFDCLYIHIKGPDEPSHDGDYNAKKEAIELIDKYFFGPILKKLDMGNTVIAITADHSTPCKIKAHSDDPVPLLVSGGGVTPDGLSGYGESSCRKGSLGKMIGPEILPYLMKLL